MKHIADLRKEKDLTQTELADLLNISQQAVSKYEKESRDPDIDVLIRIAKLFDVSTDYLLGISSEKKPSKKNDHLLDRFSSERLRYLIEEDSVMDISSYSQMSRIPVNVLEGYTSGQLIPSTYDLCKLVEVLDTSADYLFEKSDVPHPSNTHNFIPGNGFPVQLRNEMDGNYLEAELAERLDISISDIKALLSGESAPDPSLLYGMAQIFRKSTDYLLGIAEQPRRQNTDGNYPFLFDKKTSERLSRLMDAQGDNGYWADFLSITEDEVDLLKEYGFVVHFSVLIQLADMLHVSIDYLAGRTNAQKTLSSEDHEEDLLLAYRHLDSENKPIAYGDVMKLKKEQERDYYLRSTNSVAAEEVNRGTGTDGLGK